jgi:hypothetical protein
MKSPTAPRNIGDTKMDLSTRPEGPIGFAYRLTRRVIEVTDRTSDKVSTVEATLQGYCCKTDWDERNFQDHGGWSAFGVD